MAKNYITWILLTLAVFASIFFVLNIAQRIFVEELIQEVAVEEMEKGVSGAKIGEKAPYWKLPNLNNDFVSLSDFSGNPIVITFWTSWNPISADQIRLFDEYLSQNKEAVFNLTSINSQEDKTVVSNFIRRGGYRVPVLLDQTGEVGELYGARILPLTYFIDKESVIQDVFLGVLDKKMLDERVGKMLK